MCIAKATINVHPGFEPTYSLAVFGIAVKVGDCVRTTRDGFAVLLGNPSQELLDRAATLLQQEEAPGRIEQELRRDDPQAESRQWLIGSARHEIVRAWNGDQCSGFAAALFSADSRSGAMGNWMTTPEVARLVLAAEGSPLDALTNAVSDGTMLLPPKSGILVTDAGDMVRIDYADRPPSLWTNLRAGTSFTIVPRNISRAWDRYVVPAYALIFHSTEAGSTQRGLNDLGRARLLDPNELQGWIWAIFGLEGTDRPHAADHLFRQLLRKLDSNEEIAKQKAHAIFSLVNTSADGLGRSTRELGEAIISRNLG
ncbi:MAG: DUF1028 domain-containing protein [Bdellovibrionales bacterium]|nr:DUF1028 domain-containing protein [Bdellovibrionales bacterium]